MSRSSSLFFFSPSSRRRNCDSDCSDGEEDFYYTEIKLNTDSVADGLSSLSPVSPSILPPPPPASLPSLGGALPDSRGPQQPADTKEPHGGGSTPLSRSAPSALYLIHTDHAYQVDPEGAPAPSSRLSGMVSCKFRMPPPGHGSGVHPVQRQRQRLGLRQLHPHQQLQLQHLLAVAAGHFHREHGENGYRPGGLCLSWRSQVLNPSHPSRCRPVRARASASSVPRPSRRSRRPREQRQRSGRASSRRGDVPAPFNRLNSSPLLLRLSSAAGRCAARGRNAARCTGWRTGTCGAPPAAGKKPVRDSPTERPPPALPPPLPTAPFF